MYAHLLVEHDERGIARLTLNRPDVLNAFDEAVIAELTQAFTAFDRDDSVRAVVLAGAGRAFCAGADIAWMRRAAANDAAANLEDARRFGAMMDAIHSCGKPVIARIHGAAFGGGVGLACAADIAIASEGASFAVSEAKFGILPGVIGPYLIASVGVRQAARLALTCRRIDAHEALAIGLVHELSSADQLDQAIEASLAQLSLGGPQAQRTIKELYREIAAGPITAATRELTAQTMSRLRATTEAAEGFAAFQEKRPASWVRNRARD